MFSQIVQPAGLKGALSTVTLEFLCQIAILYFLKASSDGHIWRGVARMPPLLPLIVEPNDITDVVGLLVVLDHKPSLLPTGRARVVVLTRQLALLVSRTF